MSDVLMETPSTASAQPGRGWIGVMERLTEDAGYLEPLGADHWAFFVDEGPALLVCFETAAALEAASDGLPAAYATAKANGWSMLCLISNGETWYRDRAVYGYLDRQIDDGFFEDFDQVLFFGAGIAGYAAAAFSVAAPGATVLTIAPFATMDPASAGWDTRHRAARRRNFTDRFGYAPDMIDGAGKVWVVLDPSYGPDAMHAALFRGPHVERLAARFTGAQTEGMLAEMQLVPALLQAAMAGSLTGAGFAKLWRGRRNFVPYLRTILQRTQDAGSTPREIKVLRSITRRMRAPRLARRLAALTSA